MMIGNPHGFISDCTVVIRSGQHQGKDLATPYIYRGMAYNNLGDPRRAIEDYNEAIRLDPEYTASYYNRGQAYFTVGRPRLAVKDHTRAIELSQNDPQQPLAYAGRAMAYTLLEQDEEAQGDMSKAIELGFDPGLLVALINEVKDQR